jgi:hypothetical protein
MKMLDEDETSPAYLDGLRWGYWVQLPIEFDSVPARRPTYDRGAWEGDRLRQRHRRWVARLREGRKVDAPRSELLQALMNECWRFWVPAFPPEPVPAEAFAEEVERILRAAGAMT